jgi:hypothetical protein
MIMLGPADFYVLTGIPGEFQHPTVTAAVEKIARAAKNTGKHWASTCGGVEQGAKMIALGARLVFHGCDIVFVKNGLDQLQATFGQELGIRFGEAPRPGKRPKAGQELPGGEVAVLHHRGRITCWSSASARSASAISAASAPPAGRASRLWR